MCALIIQQGCDVALETLHADMEQEVTKETSFAGIWTKLTSLYMTKSLANILYPKKKLYTLYMSPGMKLGNHIDEFNKLILDITNIDIEIEDEDWALMILMSLTSSYENFIGTLLYGRESLTIENVLTTLNLRELKKRTEGIKEENGDGLYVREMLDHSGKAHFGESSRFKSRGEAGKLKCFICHSEGNMKRDYLIKKLSGFVKKGKQDQDSNSFDDEGNAYIGEAYVVVGNDEMIELGAQGNRETEIFQVSNDDVAMAQRWLEDKQLEEKTNTDCLVKEHEKVHLGIKVRANIMVTGVHG
ncbi:hypothetical protein Tco_0447817 [Tanacetum coccineum]